MTPRNVVENGVRARKQPGAAKLQRTSRER